MSATGDSLLAKYLGTSRLVDPADAAALFSKARRCGHCNIWTRDEQLRYGHCRSCMTDPEIARQAKGAQLM